MIVSNISRFPPTLQTGVPVHSRAMVIIIIIIIVIIVIITSIIIIPQALYCQAKAESRHAERTDRMQNDEIHLFRSKKLGLKRRFGETGSKGGATMDYSRPHLVIMNGWSQK